MSRKNALTPYQAIVSGDMSLASITSTPTHIQWLDDIGVQLQWSGSPVGTFAIQVSLDYNPGGPVNSFANAGTWTSLTFTYWNGVAFVTATSLPTSAGSPIYIDLSLLSAPWIRVVYTKISGTGSLDSYISGKEV